jgi:hypothetical protein
MARLMNRSFFVVIAICLFIHVSPIDAFSQSADFPTELKWLTNSDGWNLKHYFDVSSQIPIERGELSSDMIDKLSPCVRSSILKFKENGTYTEVFPVKDCPDQLITDESGRWEYLKDPSVRNGIIAITLFDSEIQHYVRDMYIISMNETTLMVTLNPHREWSQKILTYKKVGSNTISKNDDEPNNPTDNPYQTMVPKEADLNLKPFFTDQEITAANTALGADYLTDDEKKVFLYTNLARMYPRKFIPLMEKWVADMPEFIRVDFPNNSYYKSLMVDLKSTQPMGKLMPDKTQYELAKCWAIESGKKGIIGHDRITCEDGYNAENCSYGYYTSHEIVFGWLIDYDVPSLGHRYNILEPGYKLMGVSIGPHKGDYGIVAVQDFSL